MQVLFLLKDCSGRGQALFWHHLTEPIFHPRTHIPTSFPYLPLQAHVRGVWFLLCQHCTHNGRLQENIRQLLIYRIIRGLYLLWRPAKVPDAGRAVCSESVDDIWSSPRPKPQRRNVPVKGLTPVLYCKSIPDIQTYLSHMTAG